MKILAISDVHSNENNNLINYLDNNNIDLLLMSGDITNFGPLDFVDTFIGKIINKCDIIAIPGNCDPKGVCKAIEDSGAICLHNKFISFDKILIFGYGGSNPTPFNTPCEIEDDKIYEDIYKLISKYENLTDNNDKIKILLSHAPPYNSSADLIESGDHVGSQAIRKITEEFDLDINLCGHIHEARSLDKIENTVIANPGILENNGAILINIDNNKFDIDLISL